MLEQPVERGVVSKVTKDLKINYYAIAFAMKPEEVAFRKAQFTAHIYEPINNDPHSVSS